MSRLAKILFIVAVGMVVSLAVVTFLTEMPWINLFTMILYAAGGLVLAGIAVDFKFYKEFFSMRTAKHGLNMGASILIGMVILVCVNYLASRHNKTWDLSKEKLNSLSDQSVELAKGLKEDVQFTVFNGPKADPQSVAVLKNTFSLFTDASGRVKVRFLNQYSDPGTAAKYLAGLQTQGVENTFVFAELGGKKVQVPWPFDEAAIDSALIRLTRSGEAKVYFLSGHGEKDFESDTGIRDFVKALEESSFKVERFNLLETNALPQDAGVIAIVGPTVQYMDAEIKLLRQYAENGGRFFIALDPGQRSNLAGLIKTLGVEFENNYVLTMRGEIEGGGPATIAGVGFDAISDVTKNFGGGQGYARFELASELKPAPDKPKSIQLNELVKSSKYTFTVTELNAKLSAMPEKKSVALAMEARGKIDDKSPKPFWAVIFGDSEFLTDRLLPWGLNRDLGMNALAALTEQKDLLSIRAKVPDGTMIMMTEAMGWTVLILCILLPLALLAIAGVMWFRRRGA